MRDKHGEPIHIGDKVTFEAGSGHIHTGIITHMAANYITVTYTIRIADGGVMSKDQIIAPENIVYAG